MKNERELLMLFYDSDNCREVLRQPFLQDGKVCATDGHVLIRIDSSLCEGSYEEKPGGLTPPRTASVVPPATTDIAVSEYIFGREKPTPFSTSSKVGQWSVHISVEFDGKED